MNAAILFYFGWLNCGVIFVFYKNVTIFVMSNILKGGESCHNVAGIFYACYLHTAVPNPRDGVCNAPTALGVLDSGTGGTVSFRPNLDTKRLMRVNYDHVFVRGIVDPASMFL